MARDPHASESELSAEEICGALDDPDCRTILRHLEEPMTAAQLNEICAIPQSTLYRKLELLTEASLLEESTEIRADGHHASKYSIAFTEITIGLDADRSLTVTVDRPARTTDERVADLWSEVREKL